MAYQAEAARKSDFERTELNKEKTGVQIEGVTGPSTPSTAQEIPIFISDYVLMTYGTGAIMAVPAHDTRDWEFAKKFGLPIIEVVRQAAMWRKQPSPMCSTGMMVNSGFLDGLTVEEAKKKIIDTWLEEGHRASKKVNYKLRDWVFSRQRYWGEPIPMVHCDKCGMVPVPEERAAAASCPKWTTMSPPTTARAPLAAMTDWVNTTCPHCGGPAKRETDTMPQWAGSSWYFLRYMRPAQRQGAGLQGSAGLLAARWTGTTAAWSTPPCTCCTAVSGTSSCMISAWCPRRNPTRSAPATA